MPVSKARFLGLFFILATLVAPAASASAATPPALTNVPVVSASTLVADSTTPYTVSLTFTDADGYNDIRCIRVLFNCTEAAEQSQGRGYMDWGKTDADVTQWGGTWVIGDATKPDNVTHDGRWAYRTDAWGGVIHITPQSCQTSTSGKATGGSGSRTVIWTFTVMPTWAFNPVMNDADAWAADGAIGGTSYAVGWFDGLTSFDVVSASCESVCATPQPPVVSNPTTTTAEVAINPADTSDDVYAPTICVSTTRLPTGPASRSSLIPARARCPRSSTGKSATNPDWARSVTSSAITISAPTTTATASSSSARP